MAFQWSIQPYYSAGATESKSVVLRTEPQDALKQYSGNLTALHGKYNPGLQHPQIPGARLPGWIFSSKQEAQIRGLVNQIANGQVAPMPQAQNAFGQPNQFTMTSAPGLLQPAYPNQYQPGSFQPNQFQPAQPGPSTMIPITVSNGQIIPKSQTIVIPKPVVGETMYVIVQGQKYPMIVQSVVTTPNGQYVKGATVKIGDQISQIELDNNFNWTIPGYSIEHSITS